MRKPRLRWHLHAIPLRNDVALIVLVLLLCFVAACSNSKKDGDLHGDGAVTNETNQQPSVSSGRTAAPTSTPVDNQNEGEKKRDLIRWGTTTFKGDSGFLALGVEKGFFEEQGIDIEWVLIEGDTVLLKGLLSGEIDIGEFNSSGALDAIAEGAKLKVVGATLAGIPHIMLTRSDIKTPKDLEGRSLNVHVPGGFFDMITSLYLRNHEVDAKKVNKAAIGGSAAGFQAVMAGKVDATPTNGEYSVMIKDNPDVHVLSKLADEVPHYIRFALIARGEMIENNPDLLQRFMIARSKTIRYAIEHPGETKSIGARLVNLPPGDPAIDYIVDRVIAEHLVQPDLSITPEQINFVLESRMMMDPSKKELSVDEVLDTRFQEGVVKELGAWEW